ncbi:hypothetical protein [Ornithinimicrobium sufpigmenti]|uniref:hypothetical protein n=1 Tax=Ornithinimicrobium sufpigmenti TaxID=2508882 RepID=UPI001036C35C|nr:MULTISPECIES: hypothetical protein [unclassified Ornithinimicrobium]
MSSEADRRTAQEAVAAYHEAELARLVEGVGEAIDGFRSGKLDAFAVDEAFFQYSRAARELWKFCNSRSVDLTVSLIIGNRPSIDWWERGALRKR